MYTRVRDIFNRPIASVPSSKFELTERVSDDYNWTYRFVIRKIEKNKFTLLFLDTQVKQSEQLISARIIILGLLKTAVRVQRMLFTE